MKIVNNTDLSYSTIGLMIDKIIENDIGDTHYYGQVEVATMEVAMKKIKIQIRYLKSYVEWGFYEED